MLLLPLLLLLLLPLVDLLLSLLLSLHFLLLFPGHPCAGVCRKGKRRCATDEQVASPEFDKGFSSTYLQI
jgi:hypothetical protein